MIEWTLEFTTKINIFGPIQSTNNAQVIFCSNGKLIKGLYGNGNGSGNNGSGNNGSGLIGSGLILDSRVIVSMPQDGISVSEATRLSPQAGDETGYAAVDSEIVYYENDSEISPDIINTLDSDGNIVKIIRRIQQF
jgi:hypothetical protein